MKDRLPVIYCSMCTCGRRDDKNAGDEDQDACRRGEQKLAIAKHAWIKVVRQLDLSVVRLLGLNHQGEATLRQRFLLFLLFFLSFKLFFKLLFFLAEGTSVCQCYAQCSSAILLSSACGS